MLSVEETLESVHARIIEGKFDLVTKKTVYVIELADGSIVEKSVADLNAWLSKITGLNVKS